MFPWIFVLLCEAMFNGRSPEKWGPWSQMYHCQNVYRCTAIACSCPVYNSSSYQAVALLVLKTTNVPWGKWPRASNENEIKNLHNEFKPVIVTNGWTYQSDSKRSTKQCPPCPPPRTRLAVDVYAISFYILILNLTLKAKTWYASPCWLVLHYYTLAFCTQP